MSQYFNFMEIMKRMEFAKEAYEEFLRDPRIDTFTSDGEVMNGQLFAVKWARDGTKPLSVMVFVVQNPVIFGDIPNIPIPTNQGKEKKNGKKKENL